MYKIKYELSHGWAVKYYDDKYSMMGWQLMEYHRTQEEALQAVKELKRMSRSKNVQSILKQYGY